MDILTVVADRETASGEIGLIQAFVNTVDLQDGPEELANPNTLKAWLVARALIADTQPVDGSDLKHAIALREAVRGAIGPNSGFPVYPVDVATLNGAATASGLRMRFGADGKPRLEPEATGAVGAMGRIVATLYAAMVGVLRPVQEPLEPLVQHGFLRKPREGQALPEPENEELDLSRLRSFAPPASKRRSPRIARR
jgi:hypothetical protein